ncbi:hypothetical protein [Paraburkholderia sp. BL10I2N1]|uniref:hypothetical protein n=1 Tax=Paraburkholderia sp. BL10I2N1 TaxID=1938796 RepID=UPI00105CB3E0|nr:hypothetical protein [Paraburkholderia sp. BL10I2N1]TDN69458.1 hypothetical protein B0G77_2844 [Paraburkholderia sp. BL10I2N1]
MRSRERNSPDSLARLFLDVTGELPGDASLLRMRRIASALNLRDNDALWSVLAALEYYARLYEAVPERIRQARAGSLDTVRAEARAATEMLMAQHRDALARCKATIELAEQLISEHEARYRAALAELNHEALAMLAERSARRIARTAGNRLVGVIAIAAGEQRQRLDAAVASFEQAIMRRLVRACYALVAGGLVVMLLAAGAAAMAGWWTANHLMRADGSQSARAGHTSSLSRSMHMATPQWWPSSNCRSVASTKVG